ncbi:hypothetical protein GCM10009754_75730 [Amycolatopsis minnesotensis]|uniref:Uncharacterized protein n=1 Tax=Amycolatopsis minnesotensis TaxID=337894 RepID=A0ABP5DUU6_9PSEU
MLAGGVAGLVTLERRGRRKVRKAREVRKWAVSWGFGCGLWVAGFAEKSAKARVLRTSPVMGWEKSATPCQLLFPGERLDSRSFADLRTLRTFFALGALGGVPFDPPELAVAVAVGCAA